MRRRSPFDASLHSTTAIAPSRPTTHLRDAALLTAAGVAGFGAAPLVGCPGLDVPSLLLGVGGGAALAVTGQRTKLRRELEITVQDSESALALFTALGYDVVRRYQKIREEWRLGSETICLDHTPIGDFVEFEGNDAATAAIHSRSLHAAPPL